MVARCVLPAACTPYCVPTRVVFRFRPLFVRVLTRRAGRDAATSAASEAGFVEPVGHEGTGTDGVCGVGRPSSVSGFVYVDSRITAIVGIVLRIRLTNHGRGMVALSGGLPGDRELVDEIDHPEEAIFHDHTVAGAKNKRPYALMTCI